MLPKENRLAKIRDFNLVIKHGRWANGAFLDIKYVELAKIQTYFPKKIDLESFKKQLKLAFSVGLKVSKSAVKRNRVRRQMREVVRLLIKEGKIKEGYYVLFTAKPDVLTKDFAEISQEMNLLLNKAKIIKL
ncbi:MAG: ribonuclease P protein component [Patescibacteria group bacterium]|nr:ribonuclease P protein component [Patescibacteria group bacterium]